MIRLIVGSSSDRPIEALLRWGVTLRLGRSRDADLVIPNPSVSRQHAEFQLLSERDERVLVRDMGSRSGSYVNGERITEAVLAPGGAVRCGDVEIRVERWRGETLPLATRTIGGGSGTLSLDARATAEDRLELLLEVGRLLASPAPLHEVLARVLELAVQTLAVDVGVVFLADDRSSPLSVAASRTSGPFGSVEEAVSSTAVEYVRTHEVAALFTDARTDPRLASAESVVRGAVGSAMVAPLVARDRALGVLYVDHRSTHRAYQPSDLEFLGGFANQAAAAIDNARLRDRLEREAAVRAAMARFFPPSVVTGLVRSAGDLPTIDAEVTALFCDIVDFTGLCARLSPRDVVGVLNEYFAAMSSAVFAHDGTLEKYIGDAVLAVWGAPNTHADDADRALRAAVDMQRAIAPVNARLAARGVSIGIHVGLATGPVAAGNIGTSDYVQYATIGETTTIAARVSSHATEGQILMTEETLRRARGGGLRTEVYGATPLKGVAEPVTLYRLRWD